MSMVSYRKCDGCGVLSPLETPDRWGYYERFNSEEYADLCPECCEQIEGRLRELKEEAQK